MQPPVSILAQIEPADAKPQDPFAKQASGFLLAAGIIILIWVLLRLQWKRRKASGQPGPVETMRSDLEQRQADSQRAAEATDLVRDMAARLETRAAHLRALLDLADERIELLEARLRGTAANGLSAAPKAQSPDPRTNAQDPWADTLSPEHPPTQATPTTEPLHQEVYELADKGDTPLDIARRLQQQVGTIELILALRQSTR